MELASCQHRFEEVAGVHRAFDFPCPHDVVELVDEENDPTFGFLNRFQDGLQPLLELTTILGASDERSHIERHDTLVFEALGDVAANDTLGEPLRDRRLSDSRLADENGVVLRSAGENLDHTTDLVVSADDRIELALSGELREISAVLGKRLVGRLGVRRRNPLGAADVFQHAEHCLTRDASVLQKPPGET